MKKGTGIFRHVVKEVIYQQTKSENCHLDQMWKILVGRIGRQMEW